MKQSNPVEKGLATEKSEKTVSAIKLPAHITANKYQNEIYTAHLVAIVESSEDAIISRSLDGTITSWNKGSENMFGYLAEEAIGKPITLLIPQAFLHEEKNIVERIRNNEIIDHFETVRIKKNGDEFYVSLTVSPLKNS